jgi:hypothetical protein
MKFMCVRKTWWMGMSMGIVTSVSAAAAPCPGTVVLQDAFNTANAAIDLSAYTWSKIAVQGGTATITMLQAGDARAEEYSGKQYGDVNVCVTVGTPATDKAESQIAGIVFWATDYNAYYVLEVNPSNGQFAVAQRAEAGTWTFPVAWTANSAIVQGMGKTNALRVQTKGTTATLFVNDTQVGTATGSPPAGGGQVGFYGQSDSSATMNDTWNFTDFSVSSPQTVSGTVAASGCTGTAVFQDGFANPDTNLDATMVTSSGLTTEGGKGQIVISQPNLGQTLEYLGAQYGDANVCATFTTPATDKSEDQMAGLVFWATDYNNYYLVEINPTNGQIEVSQRAGGNWGMSVFSTTSTAVEKGMGKTNTVRVQTKADTATIYVNNQEVNVIYGSAPAGGGLVGFHCESGASATTKDTWEVSGMTVALP